MLGARSNLFHGSYVGSPGIHFCQVFFLVTFLSVLYLPTFLFPLSSFYATPRCTPFYAAGPMLPNFTYTVSFYHHSHLVREAVIVTIWQMKTVWLRKVQWWAGLDGSWKLSPPFTKFHLFLPLSPAQARLSFSLDSLHCLSLSSHPTPLPSSPGFWAFILLFCLPM